MDLRSSKAMLTLENCHGLIELAIFPDIELLDELLLNLPLRLGVLFGA